MTILAGLPKHVHLHQVLNKVPIPIAKPLIFNLMIGSLFLFLSYTTWHAGSNYFVDLGVKNFDVKREAYIAGAVNPDGTLSWMMDSGATWGLCCDAKSFKTLKLDVPTKRFKVASKEMLETKCAEKEFKHVED